MTPITFELIELQYIVEEAIDHAQAAMESQSEKHARFGLIAAAGALKVCNLAIPKLAGRDLQVFSEYRRQAQALLSEFWGDFGLVYLKRSHSEDQAVVVKAHASNGTKPPLVKRGRPRGKAYAPELKREIKDELRRGSQGQPVSDWIKTLRELYPQVPESTLWDWYKQVKREGEQT